MNEIHTCAQSLLYPGMCCVETCVEAAIWAGLDNDLIEHTRCDRHGDAAEHLAVKLLAWGPLWQPGATP